MIGTTRRKTGTGFLFVLAFSLLPATLTGCDNSSSPVAITSETPKPPPPNIDPVTGRPRAGGVPGAPADPGTANH